MKTPPFMPAPKPARYQGRAVIEVDCRRWATIMRRIGRPLRRRYDPAQRNEADLYCAELIVQNATLLNLLGLDVVLMHDFQDGIDRRLGIATAGMRLDRGLKNLEIVA